ncbi:5-formyltetrahydrofolate cyclo-ligase [Consotaella aegiceratis]|uniref:5-formyltetrahydrofolate cyclo-ligase n=1 Tax=Consotaella aegiceratis TaxID=3097961 RepID=UPI002F423EC7
MTVSSALSQDKARVRREALVRRDGLDAAYRAEASLAIAARCDQDLAFEAGTGIAGFLPIRSEIDPRPLMAMLEARGARIAVPAIVDDALQFREHVQGVELVPQGFGTFAPGPASATIEPAILLMPLAAFDRRGGRIGYGRAFYDRAVAALRAKGFDPFLVGLGFAVQEVDHVPTEPHDVPLGLVVTERESIRPSPRPTTDR